MIAKLLNLEYMYFITGVLLIIVSLYTLKDKTNKFRYTTALFWTLFGLTFMAPILHISNLLVGIFIVIMAGLSFGKLVRQGSYGETSREEKAKESNRWGNSLFIPILIIPFGTFAIAQFTKLGALVGLGVSSIVAAIVSMIMFKEGFHNTMQETRRMADLMTTVIILPQFLAALGAIFTAAGVGKVVSDIVSSIIPVSVPFATLAAYFFGMALFTIIMGNAFAAFSVITVGIGIPLVIQMHGANAAIVGSLAMVAGYCGTLTTPMAANFNIIPTALLEMKNKTFGVIKKQVPVAIVMWISILIFAYFVVFK